MIDWATIRPTLKSVVENISEVADLNLVGWMDQQEVYGGVRIRLEVGQVATNGIDEDRQEYNLDTELLDKTICGIREFTWSINVESNSQEDEHFALAYVERIRTRLKWESSRLSFRTANVAVVRTEQTLKLEYRDDHTWSNQLLDVRMSAGVNDLVTDDPGYWIERVEVIGSGDLGSIDIDASEA